MRVSIHQPDFMPWLGLFYKINKSDVLVILDHTVNNVTESNSWLRRVKLSFNGKPNWFSVPLRKEESSFLKIRDFKINTDNKKFYEKKIKSIKQEFLKTKYFDLIFPFVEDYFLFKNGDNLLECNLTFIKHILKLISIDTRIILSSDLNCVNSSTDLLVEIVKKVNGKKYISGDGSDGYLKPLQFKENNIKLEFNNFSHPIYKQKINQDFISGLSIIDSLMYIGPEEVKKLLNNND
tara:strand:+ start:736 stop:1443 length:708 start_codon:yes stop_codon:yes gene_type:complete